MRGEAEREVSLAEEQAEEGFNSLSLTQFTL